MVPPARDAHIDFVRLAAEEPSSLYFEEFLRAGYEGWPRHYQVRFPGLASWCGVSRLKQSLRRLVTASDDCSVLLASRSLPLLQLGASCLFRACRNVLTTDLSWPAYQQAVDRLAMRTGNRVTKVAICDRVFHNVWNADDIAGRLAEEFICHGCDGLFLPAIDHLGIRLPIRQIIQRIHAVADLRFCLIDAAQALCHVPLDEAIAHADFIVAGSHKWMGAYLPMGIAFVGRQRSKEMILRRHRRLLRDQRLADPLLHITEQLTDRMLNGRSETANVASLFACAAAAESHACRASSGRESLSDIDEIVRMTPRPIGDWSEYTISRELQSRIRIFRQASVPMQPPSAADVRQHWLGAGCVVSGYDDGRARLSFLVAKS